MKMAQPNADALHQDTQGACTIGTWCAPRDIIVKPHFLQTKEALMRFDQDNSNIKVFVSKLQVFEDLAPIKNTKEEGP